MLRDENFQRLLFLLLYAFLGWAVEVCWYSIRDRHFVNRGFLTLPFNLSYGIAAVILLEVLPTLGVRHYLLELIATVTVLTVIRSLAATFTRRMSHMAHWEKTGTVGRLDTPLGVGASVATGVLILVFYHVVHPVLATAVLLIPSLLLRIVVIALAVAVGVDFLSALFAVRHGRQETEARRRNRTRSQELADRISDHIWRRLQRAYPGIQQEEQEERYTFAKGMCLDKLVWIFLICALLGDIIETFYCGLVDGHWMNRSSVLYGPFSFVWGLGAVVLTVTLRRFTEKSDRWVFVGGFVIGGVYEYSCSVFTELVFGTVFWDYSDMPLNIGGRTNVLFCFFWGILALVWVKMIDPPLERAIERIPAVAGKILTWVLVFTMACNGLLTAAAMFRYNTRAVRPEPSGAVEAFLDRNWDDAYMERRWPNMIVT